MLAGGLDHTTFAFALGAGVAGEVSLAVAPDHHLTAIGLAIRLELGTFGYGGAAGGRFAALALEAAAHQHLAARCLRATGVDLCGACDIHFVTENPDFTAVHALGTELAGDIGLLSIGQNDGAAIVGHRVGNDSAADMDHRVEVFGGPTRTHGDGAVADVDLASVAHAAVHVGVDTVPFPGLAVDGDVQQAVAVEVQGGLGPGGELDCTLVGFDHPGVVHLSA